MINTSKLISNFFNCYLLNEKGYSINTRKSYRDTFILYFKFLNQQNISLLKENNLFTQERVLNFLQWLETNNSSTRTVNQRLAAIKSFCNYAVRYCPDNYEEISSIKGLKPKKCIEDKIDYLSKDEIGLLLNCLNDNTEIKDLAIISLLYESAARIQELMDLKTSDLNLDSTSTVILHGKGNKVRIIPINERCRNILKKYINKYQKRLDDFLFLNHSKQKFTRAGITYIINKYVNRVKKENKGLFCIKVHPHIFRHSKAMHMLENGVNLIYIRDFLGHTSVTTTEIYAKCNPEIKRKYVDTLNSKIENEINQNIKESKDELLKWLKTII